MARIRTIKPDFFTSDDVCALSPLARLLYIGLWCEADREGRMVWAPRAFKRRYLPDDDCDIDALCEELRDAGLVVTYGDTLAHIPTFLKHQHVNPRETLSVLPSPNDDPPRVDDASGTRSDASVPHREERKEGKGKERNVTRDKSRKTELPSDWQATEAQLAYAKQQGCPFPPETAEDFRLYHLKNATKHVDWDAAWQYWCRQQKNFRRGSDPPSSAKPKWN